MTGFPQLQVFGAEVRVVPGRGQGGHVEAASQPCPPTLGEASTFPDFGLPRHRRDTGQAGDLLRLQGTDLGQFREYGRRSGPGDAGDRCQGPVLCASVAFASISFAISASRAPRSHSIWRSRVWHCRLSRGVWR